MKKLIDAIRTAFNDFVGNTDPIDWWNCHHESIKHEYSDACDLKVYLEDEPLGSAVADLDSFVGLRASGSINGSTTVFLPIRAFYELSCKFAAGELNRKGFYDAAWNHPRARSARCAWTPETCAEFKLPRT